MWGKERNFFSNLNLYFAVVVRDGQVEPPSPVDCGPVTDSDIGKCRLGQARGDASSITHSNYNFYKTGYWILELNSEMDGINDGMADLTVCSYYACCCCDCSCHRP